MTPKEKAVELHVRFQKLMIATNADYWSEPAKEAALIVVDEINQAIDFDWMEVQNLDRQHAYWEEVKSEIEKL